MPKCTEYIKVENVMKDAVDRQIKLTDINEILGNSNFEKIVNVVIVCTKEVIHKKRNQVKN